jgi:hypothetical protein
MENIAFLAEAAEILLYIVGGGLLALCVIALSLK